MINLRQHKKHIIILSIDRLKHLANENYLEVPVIEIEDLNKNRILRKSSHDLFGCTSIMLHEESISCSGISCEDCILDDRIENRKVLQQFFEK